ncbi:traB domain-containing protein isoform X1 [Cucurbita pepo subsp. pepo]|uniref:traB domain-containing protein isoform X1 n=1 Tax=Cucurbita pepo subsp. pepo TaxID=3664 RepID=UPI000C9D2B22|nr:traB domain-containing protein isoform X1 [Cucurbita pepo subsp. pepo]
MAVKATFFFLSSSSMEALKSTAIPIFRPYPFSIATKSMKPIKVSIRPPPSDFDFRVEISRDSRAAIAEAHPELLDLVDDGTLVLVEKRRFGPVPAWRAEFVEPEAIWLVATSHISPKSVKDVERVVRAVKPDNVVVELCRSRAGIMYTLETGEPHQKLKSNMFSLSGDGFLGAVGRSINLGGQTALALRLLLAVFSSKISSDVNRPFGSEFRAARKASEEVGAQIVLGDRPIEITLERAWNALTWNQKLSLVSSVIRGITSQSNVSQSNDEEAGRDGSSLQLYEQLSCSYPSLLQPLIHERDTYLAWSLKRSKAVNKSKRVVGVIGRGHMNGVIYAIISDQGDLRFRDVAGKRAGETSNGFVSSLLQSLVRDTIIGVVFWVLYEQLKQLHLVP